MSRLLAVPLAMVALPVALAGCPAPGTAPAGAPSDPPPTIVVTYESPAVSVSSPQASIAPSAAPSPTPSPAPSPTRLESASFFFTPPAGWAVETRTDTPEFVRLRAADGRSTFTVSSDPTTDLSVRRERAVREAGAGLLTNTGATIDQVNGFYVTSNRDTAEGKRYVVEYGFIYRQKAFVLQGSWDKREANAEAISEDVQAIVKTFKWL